MLQIASVWGDLMVFQLPPLSSGVLLLVKELRLTINDVQSIKNIFCFVVEP